MKRIKTKIRKFLGIDFTSRKELYNELTMCYDEIKFLNSEKISLEEKIIDKDRIIWDYEDEVHRLKSIIDDLTYSDDEIRNEESY